MFPTEKEKARSRTIEDNYLLYLGQFGLVLKYFRNSTEKKNQLEVVQNVAGMISRVFADLMFTEEPKFGVQDKGLKAAIDDFSFRNDFANRLHESALTQSYAGRAYFEMFLKDGLAYVTELNAANVYPQYPTMFAQGEPVSVIISWEPTIGGEPHRFIKTHTPGLITYELRKITSGGLDEGFVPLSVLDPSLPEFEQTGLDYIPVYMINNVKSGRENEGRSDYEDLRSLFEELTRVQSQVATQLKKHADAKMAVPPGVLDANGKLISTNAEMFEVASDQGDGFVIPQYITNSNPLIDAAFTQQAKIIEAIARVSEVSTVLIDWNVSGGAERVGALRLRMLRTMSKVKRKQRPYRKAITDMITDAMVLEGHPMKTADLTIEFGDGLPMDSLEEAQVQVMRYNAGLQTKEDALRALDNIEGDTLTQKLERMKVEEKEKTEAAMSGIPSFGFGGGA